MAFDVLGRLLVAVLGRGDITVLDPTGAVSQIIKLPGTFPTNLAFSLSGSQAVLVTEGSRNRLLHVSWAVDGLPLHQPQMR